ncbi:MAG: hypothetical protein HXY18_05285 [Bryobacteraceae bacterium]|nr:hypothetical protein [Bryobacteraceae bacterium]
MNWPELRPHEWPRPGSKRAWTVPLALWLAAGAFLALSPWRAGVWSEVLNRLPDGLSEDQVVVSRAFRYGILVGIGPEVLDIARKGSTRLYDFKRFEGTHIIARLRPGASVWDAQKELRAVFGDVTVRVYPIRRIVMGDTHMLVTLWLAAWAVVLVRCAAGVWRQPGWWKYRAYQAATFAGMGALLILVFANVSEATGSFRGGQGAAWFSWLWTLFYIMLTGALLWLWRYDTRTRCRVCAQALRMPVELGEEGSMVLDTPRIELVCFQGHGALTMDRWHDDWRGYRDMWEAFSHPCG